MSRISRFAPSCYESASMYRLRKLPPSFGRSYSTFPFIASVSSTMGLIHMFNRPITRSFAISAEQQLTTRERVNAVVDTPEQATPRNADTPITELPIKNQAHDKEQVVLLGTGWAGFSFIRTLDLTNCDLQVVTPRNHFLFTPLLASACVGTLEFRSISEPVRRSRSEDGFYYNAAKCTDIDTENKLVRCRPMYDMEKGDYAIRYDRLVVSVGMDVNTMGVTGAAKYGLFLKELDHARKIRYRIIECFEKATNPMLSVREKSDLLHFLVIGGGATATELASELRDWIKEDLSRLYPELILEFRLSIIEASHTILGQFDKSLQEYAKKNFYKEHINVYTGKKVSEVKKNSVTLDDGSEIQGGLIIWGAGIQSRKIFMEERAGKLPVDHVKRVIVNDHLAVKGFEGEVYAMGDCSALESGPLPATAQVAQQQGKYLSSLISNELRGKPISDQDSFVFHNKGLMAYIGNYNAITETKGVKLKGRAAWVLWRSAYLTKLLSWRNKISVWFDWIKAWFFGRDVTSFKS